MADPEKFRGGSQVGDLGPNQREVQINLPQKQVPGNFCSS